MRRTSSSLPGLVEAEDRGSEDSFVLVGGDTPRQMSYNSEIPIRVAVGPAPDGFGLWELDRGLAIVGGEKGIFGFPRPATSEPLPG